MGEHQAHEQEETPRQHAQRRGREHKRLAAELSAEGQHERAEENVRLSDRFFQQAQTR